MALTISLSSAGNSDFFIRADLPARRIDAVGVEHLAYLVEKQVLVGPDFGKHGDQGLHVQKGHQAGADLFLHQARHAVHAEARRPGDLCGIGGVGIVVGLGKAEMPRCSA